jgi:hypothetical protein
MRASNDNEQENATSDPIEVGFQTFVSDGHEEFEAVRAISPKDVTIYVENAGGFRVPMDGVVKVAFGKVTFDCKRLDKDLRKAIGHAHDAETR